jgi:ubiquinone biosynthesis protein Coq4
MKLHIGGEQVKEGQTALAQLLKQQTSFIRLPSYLSVVASSTNKVISELEKAVSTKTLQALTEAMKTPQGAANLLDALPTSEKNRVTQLLTNPSSLRTLTQSTLEQQQD